MSAGDEAAGPPSRRADAGFSAIDDADHGTRRAATSDAPSVEEALGWGSGRSGAALNRAAAALGRAFLGDGGWRGFWRRIRPETPGGQSWSGAWPLLIGVALGAGAAAAPPVRDAVGDGFERMRAAMLSRPEFAIRQLEVVGMRRLSEDALREAVRSVGPERAALAFDYVEARRRIEALGWVARASVVLQPPNTLAIEIVEREPAALWRRGAALTVLDPSGVSIAGVEARSSWPQLPLLVGPGAERAVGEALRLSRAAAAGGLQVAALTRVGERRWDLELAGGPRVMLPERAPQEALQRAVAWARDGALLERGFEVVDLRVPFAPTARPRSASVLATADAGASSQAPIDAPKRLETGDATHRP